MAAPITPLDLTAIQLEDIEKAVESPVNEWRSVPKGTLLPLIIATVKGEDVDKYRSMKVRELVALVTLEPPDEDAPPNA